MFMVLPPCSPWDVAPQRRRPIPWNDGDVAARTTLEGSWLAHPVDDWLRRGRRTLHSAGEPASFARYGASVSPETGYQARTSPRAESSSPVSLALAWNSRGGVPPPG